MKSTLPRRFIARNTAALATIAALMLGGTLYGRWERARLADALQRSAVVAGGRVQVERVAAAANALRGARPGEETQRWRDALRGAANELYAAHLQFDQTDLAAPPAVASDLVDLTAEVLAIHAGVRELLSRPAGPAETAELDALARRVPRLQALLRDLVARGQADAARSLDRLDWIDLLVLVGVLLAVLFEGFFVMRPAVQRLGQEIRAQMKLQRQLLDAVTAEQHRLGSDLHDGLLQQLTGVSLLIRSLLTRASRGAAPQERDIEQLGTLLDDAIGEARRMSRAMMPVVLEQKGLAHALEDLAKQANASKRARCTTRIELRGRVLDAPRSNHLFRIAQEAVQNALKHSQAENISLSLVDSGEAIELRVSDDGVGLISAAGVSRTGMGLRTMEYRARAIGAELHFERGQPKGTVVRCRLTDVQPWEPSDGNHDAANGR